jgi:hypothetical protein
MRLKSSTAASARRATSSNSLSAPEVRDSAACEGLMGVIAIDPTRARLEPTNHKLADGRD